ncbi:hypothetical protein A946_11605 [Methylacidiphilum kamchatkense Kam1]|uniref:Uncharacterized protein n=1 Tax=Methylacidiphilum kamchatkense Kam1 TaxID=1202785 RepID=A0A0C1V249_9BACT|nr:hypothetical protein [Methylacidiphilum kamchatkense]KIE57735.1 hypothetical protein A946_11605 [Methylacidiphilum kamchatkense Kam1]QDQ42901.1 hypothetical protein kam1_1686 [Methylacidiphilum kamchatkense Kam1]
MILESTGRKCVELPDEDWVLIKKYGFTPPIGNDIYYYKKGITVPGDIFNEEKPFEVYSIGKAAPQKDSKTLAVEVANKNVPLISIKPFWKGKDIIIMADYIVPPR